MGRCDRATGMRSSDSIKARYGGSRLGRQELLAEIVETWEVIRFPMFDPARHMTPRAES
jgi:phage terminase large subunit-like protein